MRGSRWLRLLLAAAILPACAMKTEPTTRQIHPNGLSLELPTSLTAQQRPEGFLISPPGGSVRRAIEQVSVTLHRGPERPPGEWPEQKAVAGRAFSYRLEKGDGGSGGELHVLTAWTLYPGGYVRVEQASQAEWPASPDHALAWRVMAALVEPPPREAGDAGS